MMRDIYFSDYIEIMFETYDSIIFNPCYSKDLGLYLYCEDQKPIRYLTIVDSKLTLYYVTGDVVTLDSLIMTVSIEESRFKRRMKTGLQGNLLQYGREAAVMYQLDVNKAFPNNVLKSYIRKRSL